MKSCSCKGAAKLSDMFGGIVACAMRSVRMTENLELRLE